MLAQHTRYAGFASAYLAPRVEWSQRTVSLTPDLADPPDRKYSSLSCCFRISTFCINVRCYHRCVKPTH